MPLLTVVLLGSIPLTSSAQTITGRILDAETHSPVKRAVVSLLTPDGKRLRTLQSDSSGAYAITAPEAGRYVIQARRVGYSSSKGGPVTLSAGDTLGIQMTIQPSPVAMEEVAVEAAANQRLRKAGFYERREEGFGHFIDRKEIEKKDPSGLSELFRTIPGMRFLRSQWGQSGTGSGADVQLAGNRTISGNCKPSIVVNGSLVRQGGVQEAGEGLQLDEIIMPEYVIGIEVYPRSKMPPQFGGIQSPCGAILIWTKRK